MLTMTAAEAAAAAAGSICGICIHLEDYLTQPYSEPLTAFSAEQ